MPRINLTLHLDSEVIREARVVAARRGTSVSALVASELKHLVEDDARYEAARTRAVELMQQAVPRGGPVWSRDEIHDRSHGR